MLADRDSSGPDVLNAHVHGASIPDMLLAALDQGRALYGPPEIAELALVGMSEVTSAVNPAHGPFRATVIVRCLNYAGIGLPGGTVIPAGMPEDPADVAWAEQFPEPGGPLAGGEGA